VDAFYNDTTLALGNMQLLLRFGSSFQNLFICKVLLVFPLIGFYKLIKHLALFQSAVSDSSQNRIPVTETVFMHNGFHVLRLRIKSWLKALGLGILIQHVLTFQDVIFLELFFEPLVDLVLGLCTLYDLQPVTTWSL